MDEWLGGWRPGQGPEGVGACKWATGRGGIFGLCLTSNAKILFSFHNWTKQTPGRTMNGRHSFGVWQASVADVKRTRGDSRQ